MHTLLRNVVDSRRIGHLGWRNSLLSPVSLPSLKVARSEVLTPGGASVAAEICDGSDILLNTSPVGYDRRLGVSKRIYGAVYTSKLG